jgi:hypothetical protein
MLFALPTPPRTPPSPLDAATQQRSRSTGGGAARRPSGAHSLPHSLPPLAREPVDLFSLNQKMAAAASAAKMVG